MCRLPMFPFLFAVPPPHRPERAAYLDNQVDILAGSRRVL